MVFDKKNCLLTSHFFFICNLFFADRTEWVRLSCFHFLSALSCSDGIWGGRLVRRAEWTLDSGGHTDDLLEPADSAVKYLWSVLVSFCFCCCLILFEFDNECGSVCAFSVVFLCADSVQ